MSLELTACQEQMGAEMSLTIFLCVEKAAEQSALFGMEICNELKYNFNDGSVRKQNTEIQQGILSYLEHDRAEK